MATYVVLLLVHLVSQGIFGGGHTRGGVGVSVAFGDLWRAMLVWDRRERTRMGELTLVPLLGSA